MGQWARGQPWGEIESLRLEETIREEESNCQYTTMSIKPCSGYRDIWCTFSGQTEHLPRATQLLAVWGWKELVNNCLTEQAKAVKAAERSSEIRTAPFVFTHLRQMGANRTSRNPSVSASMEMLQSAETGSHSEMKSVWLRLVK